MRQVTLFRASLAFFIQTVFPFLGAGYLVLRQKKYAAVSLFLFSLFIFTSPNVFPYIWGETWVIKSFETAYFSCWYLTCLHCLFIGIKANRKSKKRY